jgi:hypothetical protein
MSQHDLTINNQGFPAFRADLNDALQALGSTQSGTTAPSPTFANQLWYDTTNNILKIRNEDNDAWISIVTLDQSGDVVSAITATTLNGTTVNAGTLNATGVTTVQAGTVSLPAITTTGDTNTGIYFPAADTIAFTEGGVESMRIDSSGNVGIGTSSPAAQLDVGSHLLFGLANDFLSNSSSCLIARTSAAGTGIFSEAGHLLLQPRSSFGRSIIFATGSTTAAERMRIDSSGSLLVGQSTAAVETGSIVTAKNLEITRTIDSDGGALGQLSWVNNTNAGAGSGTSFVKDVACIKGIMDGTGNNSGGYITFETKADAGSRTERMRITSDGYFKTSDNGTYISSTGVYHELMQSRNDSYACRIGITAASGGGFPLQLCWTTQTNNNTTDRYLTCSDATNTKLQIFSNGNVQNLNGSYGTISDIKNKENIVDATAKLDKILNLKVRNFNLKSDDEKLKQIGFIAQEFEQVFPSLIEESPDLDNQGIKTGDTTKAIKTSVLIPILVKAIQELNAKVDAQAAEIALLKLK